MKSVTLSRVRRSRTTSVVTLHPPPHCLSFLTTEACMCVTATKPCLLFVAERSQYPRHTTWKQRKSQFCLRRWFELLVRNFSFIVVPAPLIYLQTLLAWHRNHPPLIKDYAHNSPAFDLHFHNLSVKDRATSRTDVFTAYGGTDPTLGFLYLLQGVLTWGRWSRQLGKIKIHIQNWAWKLFMSNKPRIYQMGAHRR